MRLSPLLFSVIALVSLNAHGAFIETDKPTFEAAADLIVEEFDDADFGDLSVEVTSGNVVAGLGGSELDLTLLNLDAGPAIITITNLTGLPFDQIGADILIFVPDDLIISTEDGVVGNFPGTNEFQFIGVVNGVGEDGIDSITLEFSNRIVLTQAIWNVIPEPGSLSLLAPLAFLFKRKTYPA